MELLYTLYALILQALFDAARVARSIAESENIVIAIGLNTVRIATTTFKDERRGLGVVWPCNDRVAPPVIRNLLLRFLPF
ncbi:hypothetical protein BDV41DRAFT_579529 [Aspergillus transmontanensis]|uniref:Secreted protein n=1 Tax=Aspergillus transmontanensis TaxID=1034304 RepID=A0A5N6VPK1_9EURO|nr:hypothetical protein BDV41DRAFT_579529 [Aspergillus transmontanensis]